MINRLHGHDNRPSALVGALHVRDDRPIARDKRDP
jgi:hypothetical protein